MLLSYWLRAGRHYLPRLDILRFMGLSRWCLFCPLASLSLPHSLGQFRFSQLGVNMANQQQGKTDEPGMGFEIAIQVKINGINISGNLVAIHIGIDTN